MSGNQEAFQHSMKQGHSAAWDQQWDKAATYYRQALAEFPDNPAVLTSLGLALYEMQQFDEALGYYQRGAKVSPNDAIPLEKMARIFEQQGKISEAVQFSLQAAELQLKAQEVQKAVENWVAVLRLQPENLLARTRLGMVYDRMGRKPDAVVHYLAAASIIQHSGDALKAMQLCEYVLKILPNSAEARKAVSSLKSGQMLARPGRPRAVTGPVTSPASRKPKEQQARLAAGLAGLDPLVEARQRATAQLAAVLFEQAEEGNSSQTQSRKGISVLTRGIGSTGDDQADRTRILLHLSQAIENLSNGQDNQSLAELERAQAAGLIHPACHFILGMLYNERDHAKAMRHLQVSVKHPDFALASSVLIGRNYENQEMLREAAMAYLQALCVADKECVPENQREELGQRYEPLIENQTQQEDETALKNLCETISSQLIRANWRDFMLAARQQLHGQGVIPLAEMLLESRSSQVIELLASVRQLAAQKKYASAMEEAYYALQFAPTYLPLHIQIGDLLLQEGHPQAAVSKFLMVSNLYNLRGEASQAIRLLTRVMEMAPMDMSVRKALIDLLAAQGRVDEALQQYQAMGDFYYQMSELDKARQSYLSALQLPQVAHASRALRLQALQKAADIDLQRLDTREALRIFEQIRNLQPEDAATRSTIIDLSLRVGQDAAALAEVDGYINLLESRNQRAQAEMFLENLIKDHKNRLDLRKRLADFYQRAGQSSKAIQQLGMIADGLVSAKNKPAAISILETIISLNPPNVQDYQTALKRLK